MLFGLAFKFAYILHLLSWIEVEKTHLHGTPAGQNACLFSMLFAF